VILVDTSVWVDHFRRGNADLVTLLHDGQVLCHPLVVGELACGHLRNRRGILALLRSLPEAGGVAYEEALRFVEAHRLMGVGIGWIDVHLLASAALARAALWTLDGSLGRVAKRLGLAHG